MSTPDAKSLFLSHQHGLGTGSKIPDVRKIAVLRANALGDYVFAAPALDALRAAYPDAQITLLGAPWHARFLRDRPAPIDRVLVVPPLPGVRDTEPEVTGATIDEMRAERFDVALQMHGGGRNTNPFLRDVGARLTAGLRAPDAPPLDRWVAYVYYQPEVVRYLEVARLVGAAAVSIEPSVAVTDRDRAELASVVPPSTRARVVLHPGATDPRRRWPPDRFSAVGDVLAADEAEVLVTGAAGEAALVKEVVNRMRQPALDLAGRLSLGGLAALLADAAVVVSNDTGPVHLAEAVGAATVGLYWVGNLINGAPMTRERHRPLISWVIRCPECGRDCARDAYPARTGDVGCAHRPSFVAGIPVIEVADAARALLDQAR